MSTFNSFTLFFNLINDLTLQNTNYIISFYDLYTNCTINNFYITDLIYLNFIQLNIFLITVLFVFLLGILGILFNNKNIIMIILSIELMLLAINLFFVIISNYLNDIIGQLFSLHILIVAGGETSIGLAIIIAYYKIIGSINLSTLVKIKGI